jgi:hypothetical protein
MFSNGTTPFGNRGGLDGASSSVHEISEGVFESLYLRILNLGCGDVCRVAAVRSCTAIDEAVLVFELVVVQCDFRKPSWTVRYAEKALVHIVFEESNGVIPATVVPTLLRVRLIAVV